MGEQAEEKKPKKRICAGLLAHVDSGKTTLSEALLYLTGGIRRLGRVDHGDAFLDTDAVERERGITILSKQAVVRRGALELTLLDTPGHVDFSSETERALQVLDYAVLIIGGADGVRGHTETLWRLLERYQVPTFLFVNKMDQPGTDRGALLSQLRERLGEGCVDFGAPWDELAEQAALCDEDLLERYLAGEPVEDGDLAALIVERKLFPCFFGSALKLEGVEELLDGLERFTLEPDWPEEFGARAFKITRDEKGERLVWLKITGGRLRVRDTLTGPGWEEKVGQLRVYSGAKYETVDQVPAGTVCAVPGLSPVRAGQGLGAEENWEGPELEAVLSYRAVPPAEWDAHTLYQNLKLLEEEDPQLQVEWEKNLGQVRLRLMGRVQAEVLARRIAQRFGVEVELTAAGVVYRETIAAPVEGVGHFEPLRHYAEVHILLEPLERGEGLRFATACPEDVLDGHWQRLILTHLIEKRHRGVLTGAPVTDMRFITLLTGRAHLKHTEGGDFREAVYRAVRQGLMSAKSILLEPWYSFRLELPAACVGRAMTDIQRMGGSFRPQEGEGEMAVLTGDAPVSEMGDYWTQLAAYTQGRGRLSCVVEGYRPCHDQEAVVAASGYDPDRDESDPSGSVFCSHGAGVYVPWDQVRAHMHLDSGWRPEGRARPREERRLVPEGRSYESQAALDKELEAIFTRVYGPVKPRAFQSVRHTAPVREKPWKGLKRPAGDEYLLVDGYNIIHAWPELARLSQTDLEGARMRLVDRLRNYQGWRKCNVIVVFDAYKVKGGAGSVERAGEVYVVYTKEAETADMYIEKTTYELGKAHHRVRVATADGLEQLIILGHGAQRMTAEELRFELEETEKSIRQAIHTANRKNE